MSPRIEALMASTEFEPLLDRLAGYVADEQERADFLIDRAVLADIVLTAGGVYDGTQFSADMASQSTFHELAGLLPRVMEMLTHDANYSDVLVALGAPVIRRGVSVRSMLPVGPMQRRVLACFDP